jgi:prepilin-type N-terminal cleavage/methylation domain-containing protein
MEVSGNVVPVRNGLNARHTNLSTRQPMSLGQNCGLLRRVGQSAFSMVEVMFSMAIVGVLIVALYSALASAVPMVRSCQENERVTQILSEKLDTIRLYNWVQMTNGFVQTNFVVGIEPILTNSRPYYTGTVSIVQAPISEVYRSNLLQVTVKVDWVSGSRPQSQSMVTYIAKYGLQTYIMR